MRLNVASCLVAGGVVTGLIGCGLLETPNKSTTATTHARLQRQPGTAAIENSIASQVEYSPTDAVKNTVADLLSILGNEALKQPDRSLDRRHFIEDLIRHRLSYEEAAQRALGLRWTRLNDSERQEFVSLFMHLLRDTLANNIDQYYDEQMFYLTDRRHGRFAEVRTNLVGSKVNTSLDFRLGSESGQWLIYDVVIDGTSMISSYKAQFARIIRDDSYAGLIEKMKQRNLLVKVFERTAPAVSLSSMHTAPQ
jgi:phospholipid transport system substrate-binding protein